MGKYELVDCFFFRLFYSCHNFSDFQLFWPEYRWSVLSSRNAHLVHQNWYRISFTLIILLYIQRNMLKSNQPEIKITINHNVMYIMC
jgi:hypothetical protein